MVSRNPGVIILYFKRALLQALLEEELVENLKEMLFAISCARFKEREMLG